MKFMSNTRKRLLMEALNSYEVKYNRHFDFEELELFKDEPVLKLGINWSAIGTADVDAAMKFADGLKKAAEFIQKVNALEIKWYWTGKVDSVITTKDVYYAEKAKLDEMAQNARYDEIVAWIENGLEQE